MNNLVKKVLLFLLGLTIVIISFFLLRGYISSLVFIVIIFTCSFLWIILFFQNMINKLFFGMNISEMSNLSTVHHYHSMITNLIIGFIAIIEIGIPLVWSSKGEIWKINNLFLLSLLLAYFILVMYFVFLKKLQEKIVNLNTKEEKK